MYGLNLNESIRQIKQTYIQWKKKADAIITLSSLIQSKYQLCPRKKMVQQENIDFMGIQSQKCWNDLAKGYC